MSGKRVSRKDDETEDNVRRQRQKHSQIAMESFANMESGPMIVDDDDGVAAISGGQEERTTESQEEDDGESGKTDGGVAAASGGREERTTESHGEDDGESGKAEDGSGGEEKWTIQSSVKVVVECQEMYSLHEKIRTAASPKRKKVYEEGLEEDQTQVRNLLRAEKVSTLGHLRNRMTSEGAFEKHLGAAWNIPIVKERLARLIDSPEEELHEKLMGEPREEIALANERFNEDCVSARIRHASSPGTVKTRASDIILVLGPSGSGKTFFATKVAPLPDTGNASDSELWCTVYWKLNLDAGFSKETLKATVKGFLTQNSPLYSADHSKQLKMRLNVVLDEAYTKGGDLDTRDKLEGLRSALGGVAAHVRLIVAGTGYDVTSKGINSTDEVYKYDMTPWSQKHVNFLARKTFRDVAVNPAGEGLTLPEAVEKLVGYICSYRVLHALTENARSAYFLLEAVKKTEWHKSLSSKDMPNSLAKYVPGIVDTVAFQYLTSNGLRNVWPQDRAIISRHIFVALAEEKKKKKAHFPEFDLSDELKAQALSLMNIHVELQGENVCFLEDGTPSYSITGSITIVLFVMLGVKPMLQDDWSNLEMIAALNLFRTCVMETDDNELASLKLIRLDKPVPATSASKKVDIPVLPKNTVWINGPMAPFADVVTCGMLIQAKYSSGGYSVKIDLVDELGKLGLLNGSGVSQLVRKGRNDAVALHKRLEIGEVTILGLMKTWNEERRSRETGQHSTPTTTGRIADYHVSLYPEILLLGDGKRHTPAVQYTTASEKGGEWKVEEEILPLGVEKLPSPVHVVFVTNGNIVELEYTKDPEVDSEEVGDTMQEPTSGHSDSDGKEGAERTGALEKKRHKFRLSAKDFDGRIFSGGDENGSPDLTDFMSTYVKENVKVSFRFGWNGSTGSTRS